MNLLSLPSSITQLENLCTLRLDKCVLKDIAMIGELKNLEILSLQLATIEELPEEIKQLTKLRSLNLSKTKIKVIPPNLLSSLSKLEQLYLCESFVEWKVEGGKNACLVELKDLSCLTNLEFHIREANIMPKDLFHERLERFKILIGEAWNWSGLLITRTLKLKLNTRLHQDRGIKMLLKKSEALYLNLDELEGVKSLLYELDHEGFPNLKYLDVKSGSNIEYIIHSKQWIISKAFPALESLFLQNLANLKKICHGQLLPESFSRLKSIKVGSCKKLKNLFSFSVAKEFLQLKEIEVNNCECVTEIISAEKAIDDSEAMNKLVFRQLRSLRLQSLPQLICFCSREAHPKTSSTRYTSDKNLFPGKELQSSCCNEILDDNEATNKSVSSLSRSLRLQSLSKLCFCCREVSYTETTSTSSRDMTLFNQKILFPCKDFTSFHCIQNLTSLVIKDCNSPQHLFSVSMATTLMQLKFLEINDCEMMRAILVTEETEQVIYKVSFSQLNSLKLINLRRLKGFCSGNSILIEFPSLKRLEIDQCSELKEFVFKSIHIDRKPEDTDHDSSLKPLFNEKVTFPSLETMIICRLKNLTQIYHNQLAADSFCKLKLMRVRLCEKLLTIYPSDKSTLRRFQKLLTLDIYGCGSLQEVFNLQGIPVEETKAEVATQLSKLYLCKLPNLKFVWNKDTRGILTFRNLQLLSARKCESLKHMFPTSVAKGLAQLEILEVKECGLEEIVAKEEGIEEAIEFGFPQLSTLELCHLTKLKCFYPGTHTTDWPVLKKFVASHCQGLKIIGTEDSNSETNEMDRQQPLFLFEKVIHQLDELSLNRDDIASITDRQYPMDYFHYVKVLRVASCHDNVSGFPCFLRRFYNLKKLAVVSCKFRELFEGTSLSDPVHQKLESIELWECDLLSSLAPSASFQSLTTLDVWNCQGMINLVSSSTARTLLQLMDMRIRECNKLTEIVAEEEGERGDKIVFQNLKFLKFQSLERLTGFCQGNLGFDFPALEKVIVEQCPNMNSFCQGKLITGKLAVKPREGKGKGHRTDDLNAAVKRLNEEEKIQIGF